MTPLLFRTIDLETDVDTCIQFRKDSVRVSFSAKDDGFDENEYVELLKQRIAQFPWGYVMVEELNDRIERE